MKVQRKELLDILTAVRPALAKKEAIEQLTHFMFTGQNVITFNDLMCIHHPFETEFKCSVKAEALYKALTKETAETLSVTLSEEGSRLIIKGKKGQRKLAVAKVEDALVLVEHLQKQVNEATHPWKPLPSLFRKGVDLCRFAASRNESQARYTCLKINREELMCTDGIRISWFIMDGEVQNSNFLIKAITIPELLKFDVKESLLTPSWVHFRTEDGVTFSTSIIQGDLPEFKHLFEDMKGSPLEFTEEMREDLIKEIASAEISAEGDIAEEKIMEFSLEGNRITLSTQKATEACERYLTLDYDGSIYFSANPEFLSQVLRNATKLTVGVDKIKFEADSFQHILVQKKRK